MSDGYVLRDFFLSVLRRNGVSVSCADQDEPEMLVFAKGQLIEARRLPNEVKRRLVHYFSRRYGIAIHLFYNAPLPQEADPAPTEKIQ